MLYRVRVTFPNISPLWIPSKAPDVLLHPLDRCYLIHDPIVGHLRVPPWVGIGVQET